MGQNQVYCQCAGWVSEGQCAVRVSAGHFLSCGSMWVSVGHLVSVWVSVGQCESKCHVWWHALSRLVLLSCGCKESLWLCSLETFWEFLSYPSLGSTNLGSKILMQLPWLQSIWQMRGDIWDDMKGSGAIFQNSLRLYKEMDQNWNPFQYICVYVSVGFKSP